MKLRLRSLAIDSFYPAAVTIALGLFVFYETFTHFAAHGAASGGPYYDAALFPRIIAGALIFLSFLLIVTSIRKKDTMGAERLSSEGEDSQRIRATTGGEDEGGANVAAVHWSNRVRAISGLSILIGYVFALGHFGYYLATPVMLVAFFRILGVKSWIQSVLLSAGVTIAAILFFQTFLNVVLPVGKYGFLLR